MNRARPLALAMSAVPHGLNLSVFRALGQQAGL
jgi:hypothetical protein